MLRLSPPSDLTRATKQGWCDKRYSLQTAEIQEEDFLHISGELLGGQVLEHALSTEDRPVLELRSPIWSVQ